MNLKRLLTALVIALVLTVFFFVLLAAIYMPRRVDPSYVPERGRVAEQNTPPRRTDEIPDEPDDQFDEEYDEDVEAPRDEPPPPPRVPPRGSTSTETGPGSAGPCSPDNLQPARIAGTRQAPDVLPRPLTRVPPNYPRSLVRGCAIVEFTVTVDGTVRNASVVLSSDRRLERPVLRAVRQWTYRPGERDGEPVAVRMQILIEFVLSGSSEWRAAYPPI